MKKPSTGALIAGLGFIAAAIVVGYLGVRVLVARYRGTVEAAIGRCHVSSGKGHSELCEGTWTAVDAGERRVVHGTVEGASFDDEDTQIEIAPVGNRGFAVRTASVLGYTALFFAALFFAVAIIILRESAATARAAPAPRNRLHSP